MYVLKIEKKNWRGQILLIAILNFDYFKTIGDINSKQLIERHKKHSSNKYLFT